MMNMLTNKSIFTVLYALGLPKQLSTYIVYDRWGSYGEKIEKFEEIRHHELSGHFPKLYRQRKYLG